MVAVHAGDQYLIYINQLRCYHVNSFRESNLHRVNFWCIAINASLLMHYYQCQTGLCWIHKWCSAEELAAVTLIWHATWTVTSERWLKKGNFSTQLSHHFIKGNTVREMQDTTMGYLTCSRTLLNLLTLYYFLSSDIEERTQIVMGNLIRILIVLFKATSLKMLLSHATLDSYLVLGVT